VAHASRRGAKITGQKEAATEEDVVDGWNVLVLIEVHTHVPLAGNVVQIQEDEGSRVLPLVEHTQAHLGTHAQIETIVSDRGELDGADVWHVDQKGICFVIVGKSHMAVVADAQGRATKERARVRERVVGKTAREERVRIERVGMGASTSSDSDGDPEHTQPAHRRDAEGKPITAVAVRRWDTRLPKGGGTVSLTRGRCPTIRECAFCGNQRSETRTTSSGRMWCRSVQDLHIMEGEKKWKTVSIVQHGCSSLDAYWASIGLLVPGAQQSHRPGTRRLCSRDDPVHLHCIRHLKTYGWSTRKIGQPTRTLREMMHVSDPLQYAILVNGKNMLVVLCQI
jgi:hypothetical protein